METTCKRHTEGLEITPCVQWVFDHGRGEVKATKRLSEIIEIRKSSCFPTKQKISFKHGLHIQFKKFGFFFRKRKVTDGYNVYVRGWCWMYYWKKTGYYMAKRNGIRITTVFNAI